MQKIIFLIRLNYQKNKICNTKWWYLWIIKLWLYLFFKKIFWNKKIKCDRCKKTTKNYIYFCWKNYCNWECFSLTEKEAQEKNNKRRIDFIKKYNNLCKHKKY
jgi:hypothetical protein